MYVDESGDCGLVNSPAPIFALAGVIIHELRWHQYLEEIIDFRRRMRVKYGLHLRDEIHAAAFINRPGELAQRIARNDRLTILRAFADQLSAMRDLNVISVVVDKTGKKGDYDVFGKAWQALLQRLENTITYRNFNGPQNSDERGLVLPDRTDDKKLVTLIRRMRRHNPIPSRYGGYRNKQIRTVVEDPLMKESHRSYFTQAADLVAFLLYQYHAPNSYMKRRGGHKYFERLSPILCTKASYNDALGIVRL